LKNYWTVFVANVSSSTRVCFFAILSSSSSSEYSIGWGSLESAKRMTVAAIEVKFAFTLLVLSIVSYSQVVLVNCLELLLLEFFVALLLSQLFTSTNKVIVRRDAHKSNSSEHRHEETERSRIRKCTKQSSQPFACIRRHFY